MMSRATWLRAQVGGVEGGDSGEGLLVWPETSTLPMEPFLIAATAVVAIFAGLWLRGIAGAWRRRMAPVRVFWRLGGRLGLSHGERWWLWRTAQRAGLETPITLLVSESTLRAHVGGFEPGADGRGGEGSRMLERVAWRLFGGD